MFGFISFTPLHSLCTGFDVYGLLHIGFGFPFQTSICLCPASRNVVFPANYTKSLTDIGLLQDTFPSICVRKDIIGVVPYCLIRHGPTYLVSCLFCYLQVPFQPLVQRMQSFVKFSPRKCRNHSCTRTSSFPIRFSKHGLRAGKP